MQNNQRKLKKEQVFEFFRIHENAHKRRFNRGMTRKIFMVPFFVCCLVAWSLAQNSANIVPNPGFEEYSGVPLGWFYSGEDFTRVMKFWSSPTAASPDIYGPKVYIPKHWRQKGFGTVGPKSGQSMIGITTFGCEEGKPHCREYVQIQLTEPIVAGQRYAVSYWYQPLQRSVRNNHLGICFTQEPISDATDSLLNHTTDIDASEILQSEEEWKQFSTEWTSDFEAQYLVLGNFKSDEETKMVIPPSQALGFGYYYIDDVLIHKLPPIIEVPVADDDLTKIKLEAGKTITLKNIYFDFDRTELLPLSYIELNKLIGLMQKHPQMEIEIKGHTDNSGSKEYNLDLSFARAKAVTNYLIQQGISSERISKRGYGDSVPIASNKSAEGRQKNRRVEFYIKTI